MDQAIPGVESNWRLSGSFGDPDMLSPEWWAPYESMTKFSGCPWPLSVAVAEYEPFSIRQKLSSFKDCGAR